MTADTARPLSVEVATAAADDVAAPATVLRWALRQQRRALVLWSIAVAAVSGIYASFYDVIDAEEMDSLIGTMPDGLVAALGYDQIGSAAGFLESTVYGLLGPILLLVFSISFSARILAGVEEDGSLELELSSAVSRRRVLVERYAAVVVELAVLVLVISMVVTGLVVVLDMDVTFGGLAAVGIGLFLLVLAIASIAFAAGAATGRRAVGLAAGAAVGVVGYIANALAPLLDDGRWLELVSPFAWYLGGDPLNAGIDPAGFGALVAVTVVAVAVAVVLFDRRDLGV